MARTTRNRAPAPPRRLAGIGVAAEWLDVSDRTVRRMITRGDLSVFRVGGSLKVDLHEVESFLIPVDPSGVSS